jgi:hypothetical protein
MLIGDEDGQELLSLITLDPLPDAATNARDQTGAKIAHV